MKAYKVLNYIFLCALPLLSSEATEDFQLTKIKSSFKTPLLLGGKKLELGLIFPKNKIYENSSKGTYPDRFIQPLKLDKKTSFIIESKDSEIEILPKTKKQITLINNFLDGIYLKENQKSLGYMVERLKYDEIEKTKKEHTWIHPIGCDSIGHCPNLESNFGKTTYDMLTKDVPEILLSALLSKAQNTNSGFLPNNNATIDIAKAYVPSDGQYLTKSQKMVVAGTAMIGGIAVGGTYLKTNQIGFNQSLNVSTPTVENLDSINVNIVGQNIGLKSKNPYLQLGTQFRLYNDISISIAGGSSRFKKGKQIGTQIVSGEVRIPIQDGSTIHQISMRGNADRSYLGSLKSSNFNNGKYGGKIEYSIFPTTAHLEYEKFNTSFNISPIGFNNTYQRNIFKQVEEDLIFTSEASANLNYKIFDLGLYQANLGVSATGGSHYNTDGNITPYFNTTFNFTISPKK